MDLGLLDRVAVVTGASRGLGLAIAQALAHEGCRLAICARTAPALQEAAGRLGPPDRVFAHPADVRDPQQLDAFLSAAAARWQRLDILVHNAGGAHGSDALVTPDADYAAAFDLNAGVALRATRAAVHWMRQGGYGRIILVASVYGREAGGRAAYNVAKAAEISLAKALARELAPAGILVNAVAPGSLMFPGSSWERRRQADPAGIDAFVRSDLPLGRFGAPEEVAAVVTFLASERASLVTGACWTVDGGQSRSLI